MQTVIIFGGSGFIGKYIIRHLSKYGFRIIIPYQKTTNEAGLRFLGKVGQIIPLKFRKIGENKIINLIKEADLIINLKTIWQQNKKYSFEYDIYNFNFKLVNSIKDSKKSKKFIFFSGLGIDENSKSKSIRSKFIAKSESYILNNLENVTIIRPSIVIGNNDQFLNKLIPIFKFSFFIPLFGSGESKIQPIFVEDIAKSIAKIILNDSVNNDIYELFGPKVYSYKEIYNLIANILGLKRIYIPIPFIIMRIIVSILEKTPINLLNKEQLLLFKEDNIPMNKYKNINNLGIFAKDISETIKLILKKK